VRNILQRDTVSGPTGGRALLCLTCLSALIHLSPVAPAAAASGQTDTVAPSPSAEPPAASATPAQERLATQLITAFTPVTAKSLTPLDWEHGARLAAGSLVHDLDPNNPGWGPKNPKWDAMVTLVAGDVSGDLKSESRQWTGQIEHVMVEQLAPRLTSQQLADLTHYFSQGTGKRYLAFQVEIAAAQTQVMQAALLHDPEPPGAKPSESVLKPRLRLLSLSTNAQLVQTWLEEAQRTGRDTSGFQAFGFIAGMTAVRQGSALDAIGERYAADLDAFDSFNQTALGHRFYAAFGAASLAVAPVMQSIMKSFNQAEQAKYGERWKSAYVTAVAESDR
jgi:hypothetical protein